MEEKKNCFKFDGILFKVRVDNDIEYWDVNDERWYFGGYTDYVLLLDPQIKEYISTSDSDYEGEWFLLGRDEEGNHYYNQGSFGSCSGCDWLQSIGDKEEALKFLKAMKKVVPLGKDVEKVKEYLVMENYNLDSYEDGFQMLLEELEENNWKKRDL